jgi:hypothetical protein
MYQPTGTEFSEEKLPVSGVKGKDFRFLFSRKCYLHSDQSKLKVTVICS